MIVDEAYPEDARRRSAHLLSGLLVGVGLAAGGGYAWLTQVERAPLGGGMPLAFGAVALVALVAAVLEWTRHRLGEVLATIALVASFGLTLAAVLAGLWYLVPFVGIVTIAAIFGLVDRFAIRDEMRHQPRHL